MPGLSYGGCKCDRRKPRLPGVPRATSWPPGGFSIPRGGSISLLFPCLPCPLWDRSPSFPPLLSPFNFFSLRIYVGCRLRIWMCTLVYMKGSLLFRPTVITAKALQCARCFSHLSFASSVPDSSSLFFLFSPFYFYFLCEFAFFFFFFFFF